MDPAGLRALRVGEILDVAIKIYRERFGTLVRAVAIVVAPVYALGVIVQMSLPDSETTLVDSTQPGGPPTIDGGDFAALMAGLLLVGVLSLVASQVATGASFKAVSGAYLNETADWKGSVRFAISKLRSLLWLSFISVILMGLGAIACIIPAIYLYAAWTVATPALLFEDKRGWKALKRSRELVTGRWWPTAAVLLLLFVINSLVGGIIGGIGVGIIGGEANSATAAVVNGIAQLGASALVTPFSAAVMTVIYFDLRVRKEGFDLEMLAQRVGVAPPTGGSALLPSPPLFPPPPPPPPPPGSPVGGPDLSKDDDQPPFWPPPPGWRPRGAASESGSDLGFDHGSSSDPGSA